MSLQFTVTRRHVAWGVALIVLLSAGWVARSDPVSAGGSPPGTGIARVYVTVGTNYPDALGVGPGAGAHGSPIIIVPTDPPVPGPTATELVRLDPRQVVIIGGVSAVSAAMEIALGNLLPNAVISRVSGADRYATNSEFSEQTFPIEGWVSVGPEGFTSEHPAADDVNLTHRAWNTTTGVLRAHVDLPHGAEILELKAWLFDNAEGDVTVELISLNMDSIAHIVALGSSGYSYLYQNLSSTSVTSWAAIVNNEAHSYYVYVTGADGPSFVMQVMIRYRLGVSSG